MNEDQIERLIRIEEKLNAFADATAKRVEELEEEVKLLRKGQQRLIIAVVAAVGAGTPIASALAGYFG